jgi:hypothetical protein
MDLKLQESMKYKEDMLKRKDPPVHNVVDMILNQESIKAQKARMISEPKTKKRKWEKVDYWCSIKHCKSLHTNGW